MVFDFFGSLMSIAKDSADVWKGSILFSNGSRAAARIPKQDFLPLGAWVLYVLG
jgi:hypothetical protein